MIGKFFGCLIAATVAAPMVAGIAWIVMRLLNFTPDYGVYVQNAWWSIFIILTLTGIFRFLTGRTSR